MSEIIVEAERPIIEVGRTTLQFNDEAAMFLGYPEFLEIKFSTLDGRSLFTFTRSTSGHRVTRNPYSPSFWIPKPEIFNLSRVPLRPFFLDTASLPFSASMLVADADIPVDAVVASRFVTRVEIVDGHLLLYNYAGHLLQNLEIPKSI